MTQPTPKRTAAGRVLALLDAFSNGGGALSLTELSRYSGLPLTTTHRLVGEVLEWGGLEIDERRRYRLSRKILDLAFASTRALTLRETALPYLVDLHRRTGLSVSLSVRDGADVVYLETLRCHPNYTGASRIGGRLRLHITGSGLVLLAHAEPEAIEDYLSRPLKRYTPYTPTDPEDLVRHLQGVRRNGYALAERFMTMGSGSVGAPVVGPDGTVETAVGLIYLIAEHDPRLLLDPVRMTANRISRALREQDTPVDPRTVDFLNRHEYS